MGHLKLKPTLKTTATTTDPLALFVEVQGLPKVPGPSFAHHGTLFVIGHHRGHHMVHDARQQCGAKGPNQTLMTFAGNGGTESCLIEVLAQFRTVSKYMPNGQLSRIINTIDVLTATAISKARAPTKANQLSVRASEGSN